MTLKRTVLVGCTHNIHQSVCARFFLKESNLATVTGLRDIFLYSNIIFPHTYFYKKNNNKKKKKKKERTENQDQNLKLQTHK